MMLAVSDMDGTVADDTHRQHHLEGDEPDWDAYFDDCDADPANAQLCLLITTLYESLTWHRVEIWTGRPERGYGRPRRRGWPPRASDTTLCVCGPTATTGRTPSTRAS